VKFQSTNHESRKRHEDANGAGRLSRRSESQRGSRFDLEKGSK
jgi:hypothetical protein